MLWCTIADIAVITDTWLSSSVPHQAVDITGYTAHHRVYSSSPGIQLITGYTAHHRVYSSSPGIQLITRYTAHHRPQNNRKGRGVSVYRHHACATPSRSHCPGRTGMHVAACETSISASGCLNYSARGCLQPSKGSLHTIMNVKARHPHCGVVVCGDFNKAELIIITDISAGATVLPPTGKSDHSSVL